MPNPVTQAILKQMHAPELAAFVNDWDALEALVIKVFRSKTSSQENSADFDLLKKRLQQSYPQWQEGLRPYWQASRIKGKGELSDPFLRLLGTKKVSDFQHDWDALKHLPPAREALNQYLLDQVESGV